MQRYSLMVNGKRRKVKVSLIVITKKVQVHKIKHELLTIYNKNNVCNNLNSP